MLPCIIATTGFFILAIKASVAYSDWKNSLLLCHVALSSKFATSAEDGFGQLLRPRASSRRSPEAHL